jgi:nucleotide-binding universal stress UspA family protein
MFERIVVCFDGSDLAREAFAFAVMLAEQSGVDVHGLHMIEPVPPPALIGDAVVGFDPGPAMVGAEMSQEEEDEQRQWAKREFADLASFCEKRGVTFTSEIQRGRLIDWLLHNLGESDLIAVGRKGRFSRAGVGSTTKDLVHHAQCPVMIVSGALHPVNRVISVYDGSAPCERAIALGSKFAEATGWPFTVLAAAGEGQPLEDVLDQAQKVAGDAQVVHYGHAGRRRRSRSTRCRTTRSTPSSSSGRIRTRGCTS